LSFGKNYIQTQPNLYTTIIPSEVLTTSMGSAEDQDIATHRLPLPAKILTDNDLYINAIRDMRIEFRESESYTQYPGPIRHALNTVKRFRLFCLFLGL
jgi:hypothetical protein